MLAKTHPSFELAISPSKYVLLIIVASQIVAFFALFISLPIFTVLLTEIALVAYGLYTLAGHGWTRFIALNNPLASFNKHAVATIRCQNHQWYVQYQSPKTALSNNHWFDAKLRQIHLVTEHLSIIELQIQHKNHFICLFCDVCDREQLRQLRIYLLFYA